MHSLTWSSHPRQENLGKIPAWENDSIEDIFLLLLVTSTKLETKCKFLFTLHYITHTTSIGWLVDLDHHAGLRWDDGRQEPDWSSMSSAVDVVFYLLSGCSLPATGCLNDGDHPLLYPICMLAMIHALSIWKSPRHTTDRVIVVLWRWNVCSTSSSSALLWSSTTRVVDSPYHHTNLLRTLQITNYWHIIINSIKYNN